MQYQLTDSAVVGNGGNMAGQTTGMIDWNNEVTPHQMPGNQTGRYNGMQNQGKIGRAHV